MGATKIMSFWENFEILWDPREDAPCIRSHVTCSWVVLPKKTAMADENGLSTPIRKSVFYRLDVFSKTFFRNQETESKTRLMFVLITERRIMVHDIIFQHPATNDPFTDHGNNSKIRQNRSQKQMWEEIQGEKMTSLRYLNSSPTSRNDISSISLCVMFRWEGSTQQNNFPRIFVLF